MDARCPKCSRMIGVSWPPEVHACGHKPVCPVDGKALRKRNGEYPWQVTTSATCGEKCCSPVRVALCSRRCVHELLGRARRPEPA